MARFDAKLTIGFAIAITALCLMLVLEPLGAGGFVGADFISYWCAWVAVGRGLNPYDAAVLHSIAAGHGLDGAFPYLYPPPLAVLAAPLGRLDPALAWRLWTIASALAAGVAGALLLAPFHRGADAPPPRRGERAGLVVALLLLLDARNGMMLGQADLLVLCAITAAFALRERAPASSGAALAVAVWIKTTPALLFPLLLLDPIARRRFTSGAVLGSLAIAAATLAVGGGSPWRAFLAAAPHFAPGVTPPGLFPPGVAWNLGLAGWLARLGLGTQAVRVLWVLGLLALVAPVVVVALRARASRSDALEALALAALAILVIGSPFAYVHHMVFLLPGAVPALAWALFRPAGLLLLLGLALSAVDFPLWYPSLGWGGQPLLASLNFYALLAVWGLSLVLASRRLAAAAAPGTLRLQAATVARGTRRRASRS